MPLRKRVLRLVAALGLLAPGTAIAFPPYRSTDAGTADPWTIEARLGLVRVTQRDGERSWSTPLLRLNLGLPHDVELVSELEYVPDDGQLADAAIGAKWIPFVSRLSLGIELLALLPISREGGAGVEAALLASHRRERLRVHVNAAGFHDARAAASETGWKGGAIAELVASRFRPGVELFAKQVGDEDMQALAGAGLVVKLGRLDLRLGVHLGLTDAAPDFVASLWISAALPLSSGDGAAGQAK